MKEYLSKIPQWEQEYLKKNRSKLNARQIELLEGADIKSHEGMIYGSLYRDWKESYDQDS